MTALVHHRIDSIFDQEYDLLVNPINAFGMSGRGLAFAFKQRYPTHHTQLLEQIKTNPKPDAGDVYLTHDLGQHIAHVATKRHFREHAYIGSVDRCMASLATLLHEHPDLVRVAIPALGCGLGKLDWHTVHTRMQEWVRNHFPETCTIYIFPPQ